MGGVNKALTYIIGIILMTLCSGCAYLKGYEADAPYISGLTDSYGGNGRASFPSLCSEIALSLIDGYPYDDLIEKTIVVTTIADLNNLRRSTTFGRAISDALMTELTRQGLSVTEIRAADFIATAEKKGEFLLSRSPAKMKQAIPADLIITGTFTETPHTVIINIRLIDIKTKTSLSAVSKEIVKTSPISAMLNSEQGIIPSSMDVIEGDGAE